MIKFQDFRRNYEENRAGLPQQSTKPFYGWHISGILVGSPQQLLTIYDITGTSGAKARRRELNATSGAENLIQARAL
jgi:hypothetical protein